MRHLYSELDLVLAQAIDDGAFDGLDATELASAVMSLIYEPRRGSGGEPRHYPGGMQGNVAVCAAQLKGVHASIAMLCEDYALGRLPTMEHNSALLMLMYCGTAALTSTSAPKCRTQSQ